MKISPDIFQPQFGCVRFVNILFFFLVEILMILVPELSVTVRGWFSLKTTCVFYLKHKFFIANLPYLPKLAVELSNVNHKWDMCPTWNLYVKLLYLIHIIRTYILLLG